MQATLFKTILRDSVLHVPEGLLPESMLHHFDVDNKSANYSRFQAKKLSFIHKVGDEYWLPRNYPIQHLLPFNPIEDRVVAGADIPEYRLNMSMYAFQLTAINHLVWIQGDQILLSPCGSGKTMMGLSLIERFQKKAAILVKTDQLASQWRRRLQKYMDYEPGLIKGKKKDVRDITICSIATLAGKMPEDYPELADVGLVITDECHGVAALTWCQALWPFKAAIRIGLTATPRDDGLEPVMRYVTGDISHRIHHKDLVAAGVVEVPDIVEVKIDSREYLEYKHPRKDEKAGKPQSNWEIDLGETLTKMANHPERNQMIFDALKNTMQADRRILAAVQRLEHIPRLQEKVEEQIPDAPAHGVLKGGMKEHEFEEAFEKQFIYGSLQVIKEGMDLPELDTLLMCSPVSSHGLVEQMLGRISRSRKLAPNKKKPLVFDIKDSGNQMLIAMYFKRRQVYARLGCQYRA